MGLAARRYLMAVTQSEECGLVSSIVREPRIVVSVVEINLDNNYVAGISFRPRRELWRICGVDDRTEESCGESVE